MTQDPTSTHQARTIALTEKPEVGIKDKLSEVPSKMVSLLHKALLEQKHDEADRKEEFEEGQRYLQKQKAATTKQPAVKEQEDPNMELARYIEEEEEKSKAQRKSKAGTTVPVAHHAAQGKSASASDAETKDAADSSSNPHLPGDESLDSEVAPVPYETA